jgi:hypothetical protein
MRAQWRNEMSLYSGRKCDLCDKSILSMYNPKLPYKIYCYECHRSDAWDPKNYEMEYDFNKKFFKQLGKYIDPNICKEINNRIGEVQEDNCIFDSIHDLYI